MSIADVPGELDYGLAAILEDLKREIELLLGERGDPLDKSVTFRSLKLDLVLSGNVRIHKELRVDGGSLGLFGATPVEKQTITGSRGGNAALASLLSALENYGLIIDSTT